MDNEPAGIPAEALTRAEVELLALSYATTSRLGCSCAVRFVVHRCENEPGCAHVRTYHADSCRLALRINAPAN